MEIKKELKQENMAIKSNAIAKLLYVSSWDSSSRVKGQSEQLCLSSVLCMVM